MLAATKEKNSGSEKVNKNMYYISSIKRATRKFLDVSRCSRAKQRHRNVQKKRSVLHGQSCSSFGLLDILLFFQSSRYLRPLALHDFIFSLSKPYILPRTSLLALAKSIYYFFCMFKTRSMKTVHKYTRYTGIICIGHCAEEP